MAVTEPPAMVSENWHYPLELEHDLQDVDLPAQVKAETLACAWEYTRSVIPQYSNWGRYLSFVRIVVVGIVAEFRGDLVDVAATDAVLGYSVQGLIDGCYGGTAGHEAMGREYRAYLLLTADKASPRRNAALFSRYVTALARSPRDWFRLRDCDALVRFTAAAALTCSDLDDVCLSDVQWEVLAELAAVLYDAVAFYKHRAEGETNNTFAYFPPDLRRDYYRQCRELLWALDAAWARDPARLYLVNFIRFFGGPIHMTMRRYRFVDEHLTIGRPETESVVEQTRQNFKLWNRVDAIEPDRVDRKRYLDVIARESSLLFPGLATLLEEGGDGSCHGCLYQQSYGAEVLGQFGGVQLCHDCKEAWTAFMKGVAARVADVFPRFFRTGPHVPLCRRRGEGGNKSYIRHPP